MDGIGTGLRMASSAAVLAALALPACGPRPAHPPLRYECNCTVDLGDVVTERACLRRVGGSFRMRPEFLAALKLDASARRFDASSDCGKFLVRPDGYAMPTHPFDNGADYFCEGLVRHVLDRKFGYMNADLDVVVPPTYDFAFPFGGGHGVVCADCRFEPDGEHTSVTCARCGAVNTRGELVVPLERSSREMLQMYPGSGADCES
jgi:hypothetical protein